MRGNKYVLSTALAAVVGTVLAVCVLVRTFAPAVIIPSLNIPNMVLLSLAALLLDHYVAGEAGRCYVCIPIFGAVIFGLLPFAACFVGAPEVLKLAIAGGAVFTATTWLFSSVQDRLATGPAAKAAPILSALGLYLASQCFQGWIL